MCELFRKIKFEIKFGELYICVICGIKDEGLEEEVIEEIEELIIEELINKM